VSRELTYQFFRALSKIFWAKMAQPPPLEKIGRYAYATTTPVAAKTTITTNTL